jgi:hypothetical protein
MFKPNTPPQRRTNMTTPYKFAGMPSNSAVASLVTMLVCAWFVLAGGAILTDKHSEHTVENARAPSVSMASVPEYHIRAVDTSTGMEITASRFTL